jgi:hypothetical protein
MKRSMPEVCEAIHRDVPQIVERWLEAAAKEPWFETPEEKMVDELPHVIRRLADVALRTPGDEELHKEKVRAAARHGEERREQGMNTEVIFREYHFLRIALWEYLQELMEDDRARLDAITRVDMAISVASRASLYGHHRPELEEAGEWPERVERLVAESRLLNQFRDQDTSAVRGLDYH